MDQLPTSETYGELQAAFDHFNETLFDASLPDCLITLQRKQNTMGYFSQGRFVSTSTGELVDEIAMNPGYFALSTIEETLATLAHEMVHLWQAHHGSPGRRGYHNREWANKMEAIGLMPSSTGKPGGNRTGQKMADYIMAGGAFAQALESLLTNEYRISWVDRFPVSGNRQQSAPIFDAEGIRVAIPGDGHNEQASLSEAEAVGEDLPAPSQPLPTASESWQEQVRYQSEGTPRPGNSNRLKYRCPTCGAQAWGKPGLHLLCGEDDCAKAPFLPVS